MTAFPQIVLASNNGKKLEELGALLVPLGVTLIPQGQLAIPEAEEPHPTFVENALAKARHASRLSGLPALADDSGLCVAALNGAPGVHSARYAEQAGGEKSDAANNAHLLAELARLEHACGQKTRRHGHYVCVLVFVRHALDPQPIIAEGEWTGEILDQARGNQGFGYDPLFLIPELGKTVAELTADEKNSRSHRSIAMRALLQHLKITAQ